MPPTLPRLSNQTLADLSSAIERPSYDRGQLHSGIVHLGIGAFHRAHEAVMTDAVLASGDERWGIKGASLRSPNTRDALHQQDWLYTAATCDGDGERLQVIGALTEVLVAAESPSALLAAMSDPGVKIVSLSVTEKGYCFDAATGDLALSNPDVQHDITHMDKPRTVVGFLAAALRKRRQNGTPPFTILSCDNLHANGQTLKRLLSQFTEQQDPELARFIAGDVACPSTMVDRIVPATTGDDRARIAATLGVADAWPVIMEPFCQWVIEDNFPLGRPDWAIAGAELVRDVMPYEAMKLRLLNASHSAIAYLGAVAGYETVADAMADPAIARFVSEMMDDEITPTLRLPAGADVAAYKRALLIRFSNSALRHRTQQIAMDGSQKLPPRILGTIRDRIAAGAPYPRLATVVAAWMRYVEGHDANGQSYDIRDPLSPTLAECVVRSNGDPAQLATKLLSVGAIFGPDLAANLEFRDLVVKQLAHLFKSGIRSAIA
jgi:fructuronate reductase